MQEKITALLLHDRFRIPYTLRAALARRSVKVTTARSCGEAGGLFWLKNPPHLVFTELGLRDGNWVDVLKLAGLATQPVNVIVLSPLSDMDFRVQAMECGAFDCLCPPFVLAHVTQIVEAAAINALWRRGTYAQLTAEVSR